MLASILHGRGSTTRRPDGSSSSPPARRGRSRLWSSPGPGPLGGIEEPVSCIAYVAMKRAGGFILCLPSGFLPEKALQEGQTNEEAEGLGPSMEVEAPAVRLTPARDWLAAEAQQTIRALIIDLPGELAPALSPPDLAAFGGYPFLGEDPGLFPLATEVCRMAREWAADVLQEARSRYQTTLEEQAPPPRGQRPKAKRHTVATLAQDQAALQELVRGLANQISVLLPAPLRWSFPQPSTCRRRYYR
eukprot:s7900_g1.t1